MQKISPCFFFDDCAEEAATFYVSLFAGSRIVQVTRAPAGAPGGEGSVLTVQLELLGQDFIALNGNAYTPFTDAASFFVNADTQEEIDRLSDALVAGGGEQRPCSWVNDRFGVRWQIVPPQLPRYLADPDRQKAARVMQAMMKMMRLDLAAIERAYRGE